MEVSRQLKKQIVIEVIVLIFLVGVIIYSIFAISRSSASQISSSDGMVMVVDDTKSTGIKLLSDGKGLEEDGTTYTVTNNNEKTVTYKLVLVPDEHDEKVLNQIRVSTDDLYIENLTDLERTNGGYVIATNSLDAGYTKIHLIKTWFKLDTNEEIAELDINFEYRLVIED